jgi:hypothetical protein
VTLMATPIFTTPPALMFVGSDAHLADACAKAMPALAILRVGHAAAAIERMIVTRPLAVVVDAGVSAADLARISECARDVQAEVVRASGAAGEDLTEAIRAAVIAAERSRSDDPAGES